MIRIVLTTAFVMLVSSQNLWKNQFEHPIENFIAIHGLPLKINQTTFILLK